MFFGRIRKTRWPPKPLIGWDIFDFFSETAKWNSTELDRNQDLKALYQVCVFRAHRKNKMAAVASDWLRHFDFSSETAEPNSMKLNRKQDLNALYQVCVFGPIWKTKWPPWPLIGWGIFDFSSETAEWNSAKLDRKQDLNVLYLVCVFQANREKTKWPPWPLIGWDIFRLLLWNFDRNSMKLDRKQDLNALYQVCVFQVDRKKQNGRPGLWFAETFSTFPLKLLNRIQQNLTGSKISPSSTKAYVFRADQKNKIAALSSHWLRPFWLPLWNRWTEFNETWQKASSQRPLPSLCFSGWSKKQYGSPDLWLTETYFDFSSETAERNSAKLDRKQDLNVLYQVCVFRAEKWIKNCHPGQSIKEGGTLYLGARYGALWASCLWIYLGEVRGVHQFMYMYGNT